MQHIVFSLLSFYVMVCGTLHWMCNKRAYFPFFVSAEYTLLFMGAKALVITCLCTAQRKPQAGRVDHSHEAFSSSALGVPHRQGPRRTVMGSFLGPRNLVE